MRRKHLHAIDRVGARTVMTQSLRAALKFGGAAVAQHGICVLTGGPGCGKTFAGLTLCESLANPCHVPVDEQMTQLAFQHLLLAQLRGKAADPGLRGHLLEGEVFTALRELQPVLFIDNVNYLDRKLIAQLIFLQAHADFGLILAGYRLNAILRRVKELETRSARTIPFSRIRKASLVARLGEFHDMFAMTDPAILAQIDTDWAEGNFGRWARIVEATASDYPSALGTGLSTELAEHVVQAITGSPYGRIEDD